MLPITLWEARNWTSNTMEFGKRGKDRVQDSPNTDLFPVCLFPCPCRHQKTNVLCKQHFHFPCSVGVCFSVFNSQKTFHEVKVPVCRSFWKPQCGKGKYTTSVPPHWANNEYHQLLFTDRQDNSERENLQTWLCREPLRPVQKESLAVTLPMWVLRGLKGNCTRT